MFRRLLALLLVALMAFAVIARFRASLLPGRQATASTQGVRPRPDLTLGHGPEHGPSGRGAQFADEPAPLLDSLERASARVQLQAEPERQYLDSLLTLKDSTVRRWAVGFDPIGLVIVAGGTPAYLPEMASEVRSAFDQWSPAGVGLRFLEGSDTSRAQMVIRWTDTLSGDRAGSTDVTWDRAGRIRRVTMVLATRSKTTGLPFPSDSRRAIVLHEVGHAMGLPHSPRPDDVMYPIAGATSPSDRDRFSLRLLYALPTGWIGCGPARAIP